MAIAETKTTENRGRRKTTCQNAATLITPPRKGRPPGIAETRPRRHSKVSKAVEQSDDYRRKLKAEADLKQHQADLYRIKVDQELSRLISREEVDRMLAARVRLLKKTLLCLPDRLAPELEGQDSRRYRAILAAAIRELIQEYAEG